MGDAQAPGGYFVGRPANYEEKPQESAPAPAPAPAPAENHPEPQVPAVSSGGGGGQKKGGFFGNLFSCFSAGGQVQES